MINKPKEDMIERHKAFIEYLKFLSTLSTGSIVLMVSFLENLFKQPDAKVFIIVALLGFMLTVVFSVIAYSVVILNIGRDISTTGSFTIGVTVPLTWISFIVGVISLTMFALLNFMSL